MSYHLNNYTLQVGVPLDIPFIYPCAVYSLDSSQKLCPTPGLDAEIVGNILHDMGAKYELHNMTGVAWGSESTNRTLWTGMKRMLLDGDLDFIAGFFFTNRNREQYFDMTFPIVQAGSTFVVKKPETRFWSAALLVLRVYSLEIWALFLGTILLLLGFVLFYRRFDRKRGSREVPPIWEYIRFILPEESYDKIREGTYAANLLILLMGFALILIVSLYQGSLLTVLLYPPTQKAFAKMGELVEKVANKELTIIVDYEGQWFHEMVKTSEDDSFQQLREAVKENPIMFKKENFSNSLEVMVDQIKSGAFVYFSLTEVDAIHLLREFDKTCMLQMVPAPELPRPRFQYMFVKGHWAVNLFNQSTLKRLQQIIRLRDNYLKTNAECSTSDNPTLIVKPLGLLPLTGLLLLFVGGCALACCVFLYEHRPKLPTRCTMFWWNLKANIRGNRQQPLALEPSAEQAAKIRGNSSVSWQMANDFTEQFRTLNGTASRLSDQLY